MPLLRDNSRVECFLDVAIKDDIPIVGESRVHGIPSHDDESNSIIYDTHGWNNNTRLNKEDEDTDDTQSCNTSSGSEEYYDEKITFNHGNDNDDTNYSVAADDRSYTTSKMHSNHEDVVPRSNDNDDSNTVGLDQHNALEQEMATIKFELAEARAQVDWFKLKNRNLNVEMQDLQAFCKQLQNENTELLNARTVTKYSNTCSTTNINSSSSVLNSSSSVFKSYSLWGRNRSRRESLSEDPKKMKENNDIDGNTALDCSWDNDTLMTSPTIDESTPFTREDSNEVSNKSRHSNTKPKDVTVRNSSGTNVSNIRSEESRNKKNGKSLHSSSGVASKNNNDQMMNEIIIQTPQRRMHKTVTKENKQKKLKNTCKQKKIQQRRTDTAPLVEVPPAVLNQSKSKSKSKAQRRLSNSSTSSVKIHTPLGRMQISERKMNTTNHNPHFFDVELDEDDEFSSDYLSFGGSYYKHCSMTYQQQNESKSRINEEEEQVEEEPSVSLSALSMVMPSTTNIPIDLSTDCTIASETTDGRYNRRGSHQWRRGLKLQ